MAKPKLLPIALQYVDGQREIDGATRFQKLVFLAQEETDAKASFEYQADRFGPFSPELAATLDELEGLNLIEKEVRTNRSGQEKYTYKLTDRGREFIYRLKQRDDSGQFEELLEYANEIKQKYNNEPLDRLLKYVYTNYPDMTSNSELEEFKPA